jgi:hypothetical protein
VARVKIVRIATTVLRRPEPENSVCAGKTHLCIEQPEKRAAVSRRSQEELSCDTEMDGTEGE